MKPFSLIQTKVENKIAYMMLKNPPVNALNERLLEELEQCIDELNNNPSVRAGILTGDGSFFVAGADIKEFTSLFGQVEEAKKAAQKGQALCIKIEQSEKPIIAAINGACLGGGLELAMSCHLRIAVHEAKLGLPETKLGLIPGYGGTQRLTRLTNTATALELILTGRFIDGREAERIGLVNRSVEADQLLQEAAGIAELISQKSRLSVKAAMQAVFGGAELPLENGLALEVEQFGALFASQDVQEGVTAFIQKRPAVFRDQ
ncbi:enoyl-CoA hydratase-related protein [Domibacillus sp.]|uniref:enoyl-CoA hydratase-related protein n=1 Tax=Domibacillus sp. TaxID=1969783 RepID=UPI002810E03B|nr:enoyl-CoA hydratase-related protein [Domibacillus sp.]